MSVNNKSVIKWSLVSSLLVALLGFLGNEIYEKAKEKIALLHEIEKSQMIMQAKYIDDDAQWSVIKELDKENQLLEVEVAVLKRMADIAQSEGPRTINLTISQGALERATGSKPKSMPPPIVPPKNAPTISELNTVIEKIEDQKNVPVQDYQQRQQMRFKK